MSITNKTDEELIAIALPMIDTVIKASNQKDWDLFSMYQTEAEAQDPENKNNVLKLWEENELFTSLNLEREILGVLRREHIAQIVWKQTSRKVPGEFLARYFIKEIDGQIKEVGFLIH
ncbi:hypothetical protein [Celerinatantimonas diazotrophica]|uniref:SnoaL-like protein n=1 Tax=Celerinatantimonas diazotrophica TaxID=412034 RepID=A0A4R1K155_9GAMM|nr:hypothetical protein [Celerinatantimonas diazotrophica]TCK57694.1 hypothetical protein EV690_1388 [Celerinatantimonas diazotrophica]CAG9298244.1 hypothetical protein CEDIAZO_03439 [Celerinatantimonas diazotrophica]